MVLGGATDFYLLLALTKHLALWYNSNCNVQELLDHPFLHPNRRLPPPAAAAPAVGMSEEQMKALVAQVGCSRSCKGLAKDSAGLSNLDTITLVLLLH
jgi:hypothetical protein